MEKQGYLVLSLFNIVCCVQGTIWALSVIYYKMCISTTTLDLYTIQWFLACCGVFLSHLTSSPCFKPPNPNYWGVFYLRSIMLLEMSHGTEPKVICLINTKGITKALLKWSFQLQMLTWALNFVVAYSAVTFASSSWSSHKQTHSMGSELMSADENHCWKSIQLRASAWLLQAVAPSPLCRSKDPTTCSFFSLHCNVQGCLHSCHLSGRYNILIVFLFTEGEKKIHKFLSMFTLEKM